MLVDDEASRSALLAEDQCFMPRSLVSVSQLLRRSAQRPSSSASVVISSSSSSSGSSTSSGKLRRRLAHVELAGDHVGDQAGAVLAEESQSRVVQSPTASSVACDRIVDVSE